MTLRYFDEVENKKYYNVEKVLKSNRKIVEKDEIDTVNTQIHARTVTWLRTGISIKSGGVKLVVCAQTLMEEGQYIIRKFHKTVMKRKK